MTLAWGKKVSAEFRNRLFMGCHNFGWDDTERPSWLMSCMAWESGETFSPRVRNMAGSGATGLIQFMESTAEELGTTCAALSEMRAEDQLAWVFRYFQPYYRRVTTLSDMYMAILYPVAVGKPEDYTLFDHGTPYRQNAGLDFDGDGKITKAEAAAHVQQKLLKGLKPEWAYET